MGELRSISPLNKPVTRLGSGTNMRCFREFWGVPGGAVLFFSTAPRREFRLSTKARLPSGSFHAVLHRAAPPAGVWNTQQEAKKD